MQHLVLLRCRASGFAPLGPRDVGGLGCEV